MDYTPSVLDGLTPLKERENRSKGVNFIIQVGIMLKLPQVTLATASVFLHRFFMRWSMVDVEGKKGMHYYSVGATSLFLATKVEENCRKMRELVIACVRVAQKNPSKIVDEQDKEYWRWKDTILHMEDVLLEALCFDLSLEPPYKTLFEFLVYFGEEDNKKLRNVAWAFVNDSCLTTLCLLFPSRTIAASALYVGAKHCDVSFRDDAEGRPWWAVVGVELRNIRRACNYMAGVYETSPLRNGTDAGIHNKTPEDGDELTAKTRHRNDPTRSHSQSQTIEGPDGLIPSRLSPDEGSRKRSKESEEFENGHGDQESPRKRARENGDGQLTSDETLKQEEEGEVEE